MSADLFYVWRGGGSWEVGIIMCGERVGRECAITNILMSTFLLNRSWMEIFGYYYVKLDKYNTDRI